MLPFGATFPELLAFFMQFGLAVSGAAALWGLVLTHRGKSENHGDECIIFDWLAEKLLAVLYGGLIVAGVAWFIMGAMLPAYAHVGITLQPLETEALRAFELLWPLFALWVLLSPVGLFVRQFKPEKFHKRLTLFFGAQLAIISALISIPAWSGEVGFRQLFFFTHSFHSIFTLGTVVVLDFLFLVSKSSLHLKQHIYPLFPTISKVVLVGLAIEIAGVGLVFSEAIALTPKFFFMETVIGILLINGMILAGPLTRRMLSAVSNSDGRLTQRWEIVGDICGTISVSSWFAITFIDYFYSLTLSYLEMLSIYGGVLLVVLAAHLSWNYIFSLSIPRWYFAWHRGD